MVENRPLDLAGPGMWNCSPDGGTFTSWELFTRRPASLCDRLFSSLETPRVKRECPRGREWRELVNLRGSLQALQTDFLPEGRRRRGRRELYTVFFQLSKVEKKYY